jgi:hypothetical protein
MNLIKTLTIGAAAFGWLSLAGQASAAPPGSSSGEAKKYAAATSYESGQRSYRHRSSGRSAFAPSRMESRCDARGGRLVKGRGGEWRCIIGGRSAYAPPRIESRCDARGGRLIQGRGGEWRCILRGGRTIYAPRGKTITHEREMRGGRSAYQPRSGRSIEMRRGTEGRSSQEWKGQIQKRPSGQEGQSDRM